MKPLIVDFAVPWQPGRVAWLSVIVALGLTLLAGVQWQRRHLELRAARAELERLDAMTRTPPAAPALPAVRHAASATRFIAQRSSGWEQALRSLEAVPAQAEIQLQDVQLSPAADEVRLRVVATTYPILLDWLSLLNSGHLAGNRDWQWTVLQVERDATRPGLQAQIIARPQRQTQASGAVR